MEYNFEMFTFVNMEGGTTFLIVNNIIYNIAKNVMIRKIKE